MGKLAIFATIVAAIALVGGGALYVDCRIMCPELGLHVPHFWPCFWSVFFAVVIGGAVSFVSGLVGD